MHPTTTLAAAASTVCSWSCQWKKGWDSHPTPTSSVGSAHTGEIELIIIVVLVVLVFWGLSKMRRIAS
jgi:hypothetical protein